MLITVKMYERGRFSISQPVRKALSVGEGDLVEITVEGYTSTVPIRSTGRATIPSHLRDELDFEKGDLVQVQVGLPGQ